MNNVLDYKSLLELIQNKTNKKVLLHSCCGPCSSACIELLKEGFKVDIYYSNDNIDTLNEFTLRSEEQVRIAQILTPNSHVIVDSYTPKAFYESIKGYEHLKEKSKRCYHCYKLRMYKSVMYAKEHNYDYWTTTLSISPHKNSKWINEIGFELAEKYGVPFLYSNFKLQNGYQKSIELSKKYELYRQNYCGCHYSKIERGIINE